MGACHQRRNAGEKTIKKHEKKQAKYLYISLIFINFNYYND